MRILFVSYDASPTGAPIQLLNLLRWLRKEKDHHLSILLLQGGELKASFREIGAVAVVQEANSRAGRRIFHLLKHYLPRLAQRWTNIKTGRFIRKTQPDVVYCNSSPAVTFIPVIRAYTNAPLVGHIHELQSTIDKYAGFGNLRRSLAQVQAIIACSRPVKEMLTGKYGIDHEKIRVITPCLSPAQSMEKEETLAELFSLPEGTTIIAGAGRVSYLKGVDHFVHAAHFLQTKDPPPFCFIWIGDYTDDYIEFIRTEIFHFKLRRVIHFTGYRHDAATLIRSADIFFLSSREESFGVAALEAAAGGVPVVCFDSCPGFTDFLMGSEELIVPYYETEAAADVIHHLVLNPQVRSETGIRLQQKALRFHQPEVTCAEIYTVIRSVIGGNED